MYTKASAGRAPTRGIAIKLRAKRNIRVTRCPTCSGWSFAHYVNLPTRINGEVVIHKIAARTCSMVCVYSYTTSMSRRMSMVTVFLSSVFTFNSLFSQ